LTVTALRRAEASDADAVADMWLRSLAAALPTVRPAHSDDEVRAPLDVIISRLVSGISSFRAPDVS
jgi:hypothetical protein